MTASPQALTNTATRHSFISQGTIDGWSLPLQVVDALAAGEQAHTPLLAGFNSGELRSQRIFLPPVPASEAVYEEAIRCGYGDLADSFLNLYPASDMAQSTLDTFRDAIYGWAVERLVRAQTVQGLPAYLYIFDHCYPAARERDLCAFHASELPYVFGQIGDNAALSPNWPIPRGETDVALSSAMIDYWVSFASTGAPASGGGPPWQPYADGQSYLHFADQPLARHDPLPGMFEMQDQLVNRRWEAGQRSFINVGINAGRTCAAATTSEE